MAPISVFGILQFSDALASTERDATVLGRQRHVNTTYSENGQQQEVYITGSGRSHSQ